ncbi:MAG: threonine ammonia-lyase [Acidimicrobiales bacterium]
MALPDEPPPVPDDESPGVGFADGVLAAGRLAGAVVRTPAAASRTLAEITGAAEVVVKFENLQFTGSFKDRGALNRLLALSPEQRRRGVLAVSAGNHAQGVAYHAGRLGIPATIVMPTTAPLTKLANTARLGAEIVQVGLTVSEAADEGARLAAERGLLLVHPYDDPLVIAGQATVGLELLADHPDLEVLVVPVGGGGLLAGIALAAAELAPSCELVGVQSELYPAMAAALAGRAPVAAQGAGLGGNSIADGIAVKRPGRLTTALLAAAGVEMLTVPEARLEEAVGLYLEVEKTVAEGAGAAPLAALLHRPERFAGRRVGLVLSGGNIDPRLLSSVILRSLLRQRRLSWLRVETDDLPGRLGAVATAVGAAGGNLVEVAHQRLLGELPIRRVDVDLLVETIDAAHLERILRALESTGLAVEVLDPR